MPEARSQKRSPTLPELFARVVSRTPEAIAMSGPGVRLSYMELASKAQDLAANLADRGVGPGSVVALLGPRVEAAIVSMLGVLMSGAAYLPLDASDPPSRMRRLLELAEASLLLASPGAVPSGLDPWDVLDPDALPARGTPPSGPVDSAAPAYLMATSGSTGVPKLVVVPHRAVARLVRDQNYLDFGPHQVFAQVSSLAFDASTFEIWGALLNGARLSLVERSVLLDPEGLRERLRREGVTAVFLTTALFHQLTRERPDLFSGVPHVLTGGEQLDRGAVREVLAAGPPGRLLNAYGPTEATTFATTFEIPSRLGDGPIPIGSPISGTTARILDSRGNDVQPGEVGELWLGGEGLALGYFGDPGRTEECFRCPGPPGAQAHRHYRTGDMARQLPGGDLEFRGRRDGQVKVRGFRVETGEVEAALTKIQDVEAAVVKGIPGPSGMSLWGFVQSPACPYAMERSILRELEGVLPGFMIPSRITVLETLPLNRNGKIDRAALTPFDGLAESQGLQGVSPFLATVTSAFREVLGSASFGTEDHFFDAGGDSLRAMELALRLETRLRVKVSAVEIEAAPRPSELSLLLEKRLLLPLTGTLVPLSETEQGEPFLLVPTIYGHELDLLELGVVLGAPRPVYGFRCPAYSGGALPSRDLSETAALFVEDALPVVAGKPVRLVGYCDGGILAFEMARQLEERGERVEGVFMLDTFLPSAGVSRLQKLTEFLRYPFWMARRIGHRLQQDGAGGSLGRLRRHLVGLVQGRGLGYAATADEEMFGATDSLQWRVSRAFFAATRSYRPQRIRAPLVMGLTDSSEEGGMRWYRRGSWASWTTGRAGRVDVEGGHRGCLVSPAVQGLAHQITRELRL